MKFDLWTFLFQIVNFVVLLYILKRLLFKPIREIMEKRRKAINDALSGAEGKRQEAEKLKGELGEELSKQKKLRQEAESKMRDEVGEERKRLLEGARADADKAIEKERAVFEVEKRKFESDLREKAAEVVSDYAANVLKDVSDEDLHRSIVRKFRGEVEKIASDISGIEHPGEAVALKVISAFPLDGGEADEIKKAFETSLGKKVSFSFDTDAALIAGIAVRADDKVYDFSLQGQIRDLRDKLGGAGNSWKS
jgi:F-type H+-transporting ATPase subunit b